MPQTIPMMRYKMSGPEIEIHPLADLHVGSREYSEKAFVAWRDMILSEPNRYVVVCGDITDNGVKSSVTSVYEAVMQPREQRIHAAELLAPLKDRILCATSEKKKNFLLMKPIEQRNVFGLFMEDIVTGKQIGRAHV